VSRREPPPEFFIDRSLGRRHLPEALRACGLVVHTMASVYGEEAAQQLADERWLRDVGAKGWIVLMKDDAIRRRPAERDALVEAGVRAFCLTNAQLRAAEQTERFVSNRHRIIQQARRPGPYIYGVYETGIRRLWPQG
jgi:PIN like domain